MKVVSHMLTGHAVLRRHLFVMKKDISPTCEQCDTGEEETVLHFLGNCPRFSNLRYQIFRKQFLKEEEMRNLKIKNILRFVKKSCRYDEFLMDF